MNGEGAWLPGLRHKYECRCNRCKDAKVNGWTPKHQALAALPGEPMTNHDTYARNWTVEANAEATNSLPEALREIAAKGGTMSASDEACDGEFVNPRVPERFNCELKSGHAGPHKCPHSKYGYWEWWGDGPLVRQYEPWMKQAKAAVGDSDQRPTPSTGLPPKAVQPAGERELSDERLTGILNRWCDDPDYELKHVRAALTAPTSTGESHDI
jgi:general stress protein YciG